MQPVFKQPSIPTRQSHTIAPRSNGDNGSDLASLQNRQRTQSADSSLLDLSSWSKQEMLDHFSYNLEGGDLESIHDDLRQGMLEFDTPAQYETGIIGRLFKNRSAYTRQCTRSGSLALAAFAFAVFGTRLLDTSTGRIDKDKFIAAMHTLFGRDMARIGGDLVTRIEVDYVNDTVGYQLSSGGYTINVPPDHGEQRQNRFDALITTNNINRSYFHGNRRSCLSDLFCEGDIVPALIVECIGLDCVKPSKPAGEKVRPGIARAGTATNVDEIQSESPAVVKPRSGESSDRYIHTKVAFVKLTEADADHQSA